MTLNPIPKQSLNSAILRLKHKGLNLPKEKQFGFIAQEVEPVLPNLVKQVVKPAEYDTLGKEVAPAYGFKALNYQNIIAVSVGAIQQLNAKIDSLNSIIDKLQSTLSVPISYSEQKSYLGDNIPNPFSSETKIPYRIIGSFTQSFIGIYNLLGEELERYPISEPEGEVIVQSTKLKSGIYNYSLVIDGKEGITKKMVLTR